MKQALLVLFFAAAIFLIACGGEDDNGTAGTAQPNPTISQDVTPRPTTGAAATAPSGSGGRSASLQLSGAVTGTITLQGITCDAPGATAIGVSISGTVGSAQYTVEVHAPAA